MIGKPEWFTYRIFGWGLRPKTKEGWLYILIAVLIAVGITLLPFGEQEKVIAITIFVCIVLLDTLHIMTQIGKVHDEREKMHQLIIERNCSFAAIAALVILAVYQVIVIGAIDKGIFIVLGVMVAVKIISTAYVKLKM